MLVRADKVLTAVIAAVLSAGGVLLFVPRDAPPQAAPGVTHPDNRRAPVFPRQVRGRGVETTRARAVFDSEQIKVRSALALNLGEGRVWIKLFPTPVTCASWSVGSPLGVSFLATVTVSPATLRDLRVGSPLREYSLWWIKRQGNRINTEGVDGVLTLNAIDTNPGGYWRGRVDVPRSLMVSNRYQELRGTFAAEWCGNATPDIRAAAEMMTVARLPRP